MTPTDLRSLGEKLYGEKWQTPLAVDLGVTTRSVRYWLSGKHQIRPPVEKLIQTLRVKDRKGRSVRRTEATAEP